MQRLGLAVWAAGLSLGFAQTVEIGGQQIPYDIQDGFRLIQGDIIVGVEDPSPQIAPVSPETRLWPGGVVYYAVDPDVAQQAEILEAIAHWEANTPLRFFQRNEEPNFVLFRKGTSGCFSDIGRTGFQQSISLHESCSTATIIHEIGHTVGLWHEQAREDRDRFLDLRIEALDPSVRGQWEARIQDENDWGAYDFASIMHYPIGLTDAEGESIVQSRPPGIPTNVGQGLSVGDIDGIRRLYADPPQATTIAAHPWDTESPKAPAILVDGQSYTEPASFAWAPGEVHTIEAPEAYQDGDQRFAFGRWSDEGAAFHEIQASEDVTAYTAYYRLQYRVRAHANDAAMGSVRIETDGGDAGDGGWASDGTAVHLIATAGEGYHFIRWATAKSERPASWEADWHALARGPEEYVAVFSAQPPTVIASDPPGIPVEVDGLAYRPPMRFDWKPGSRHTVGILATKPGGEREPGDVRTTFLDWSDGGEQNHTVIADAEGGSVTARFQQEFRVTTRPSRVISNLALDAGDIGIPQFPGTVTVEPSSEDGFYPAGSTIHLTAEPNRGWDFISWTGDREDPSSTIDVTVDAPLELGAWFAKPGAVNAGDVLHSAHYLFTPVAPGEIVTMFGWKLGPTPGRTLELDESGKVSTELGGTEVTFDGVPAPVIYSSERQVSVVVPYGIADREETQLRVSYQGQLSENAAVLQVGSAAPGFYTFDGSGRGQVAALNEDGSVNSPQNPAKAGSIIVLYATGTGVTNPPSEDGAVTGGVLPKPAGAVRMWIGWHEVQPAYAGAAPGLVAGVTQVNAPIPLYLSGNQIPVVLEVGEERTPNFFTIAVE